jgi:steroid Delta-isomerase
VSEAALVRIREYFESLTPAAVERMGEYYTGDAYFRDPFNEVTGLVEVQRIFRHMYVALDNPRFEILEVIAQDASAVLIWDMHYRIRKLQPRRDRKIHGLSVLKFAPDGRVNWHRDYWDAAGELYATLPVIGPVMRWLARKMG